MAVIIRWKNSEGGGDLVLDANHRVVQGESLIADIFLSLHTDAPADEGDPVPPDVSRSGYWATSFDRNAIKGSKLWIVRYIRPIDRAKLFAEQAVEDALAWLVTRGRLESVSTSASTVGSKAIVIDVVATLTTNARRTFRLDIPYSE